MIREVDGLKDVVRLPLRTPFPVGTVNSYLLVGSPISLIDTGPRSKETLEDLESGLAEHGLAVEDIELLLLTHQHPDHLGLARTIQRRSGCRVGAQEYLARYATSLLDELKRETAFQTEVMQLHGVSDDIVEAFHLGATNQRRFVQPVAVDQALADGEAVRAGDRLLEVRRRPGHSPTDTIYVDTIKAVAFVGDHLLGQISSNPVIHRPLDRTVNAREFTSPLLRYRRSLAETKRNQLQIAFTGHGAPVQDPSALIDKRLEAQASRNEDVISAIGGGAITAYEIAWSIWGETARQQPLFTLSEALGACHLLLEEGRIEKRDNGGVVGFALP